MSSATTLTIAGATIELEVASLEVLADLVADRLDDRGASEPESWLGVKEAAVYLGCPVSRIYDLVAMRKGDPERGVEFRKDGARLVFRREWLDEGLERP